VKEIRRLTPGGPVWADDYNELAAAVEWLMRLDVDGGEIERAPGAPLFRIPGASTAAVVRVTGGDSGSASGSGCNGIGPPDAGVYWPAVTTRKNRQSGAWEDFVPVWLDDANGADLEVGQRYLALLTDLLCIDGEFRPVYTTGGGTLCDPAAAGSGACVGAAGAATPLSDLIQCDGGGESGSGTSQTQIRDVCLGVLICGKVYPVVALDPATGDVLGG
jgi:hypothetical protein